MSIQVGIGISTRRDPLLAAQEAATQARFNLKSQKIDLAFVFGTTEYCRPQAAGIIYSALEETPLVGCSTLALITAKGILKHALAVAAFSFPGNIYFNTASVNNITKGRERECGDELGKSLLYGFKGIGRDFSMVLANGFIPDGYEFLNGLEGRLGSSFPLAGASASDDLRHEKTCVFYNDTLSCDSACGIVWGGKINYGLGIQHGWKPLGKPRTVTRSFANTVFEIDGVSALEIYKDFFAADLKKLRENLKYISILYPIGIYLPGEQEYLLRNLLSINENGSLVFQGNVPQESKVRLMIGTDESCLSSAEKAIVESKTAMSGKKTDFVFVFNSVSRYILLGRDAYKEWAVIKGNFAEEVPFLGIYTYGEQAPLKAIGYQGKVHFHNQTISILSIGG